MVAIMMQTPKYLSSLPNWSTAVSLVGVVHEVHVALQDLGVELERVLDDRAVLGVVLVAQHVHKGAVVDPVHAQRADEIALQQPEGLGQEQGVGRFGRHPVHHLAPELVGHGRVELLFGQAVFRPGGDGAAAARLGNHSRWKCFLVRVIAASKRMIGNWRATCRIVWITASRTSGLR